MILHALPNYPLMGLSGTLSLCQPTRDNLLRHNYHFWTWEICLSVQLPAPVFSIASLELGKQIISRGETFLHSLWLRDLALWPEPSPSAPYSWLCCDTNKIYAFRVNTSNQHVLMTSHAGCLVKRCIGVVTIGSRKEQIWDIKKPESLTMFWAV